MNVSCFESNVERREYRNNKSNACHHTHESCLSSTAKRWITRLASKDKARTGHVQTNQKVRAEPITEMSLAHASTGTCDDREDLIYVVGTIWFCSSPLLLSPFVNHYLPSSVLHFIHAAVAHGFSIPFRPLLLLLSHAYLIFSSIPSADVPTRFLFHWKPFKLIPPLGDLLFFLYPLHQLQKTQLHSINSFVQESIPCLLDRS